MLVVVVVVKQGVDVCRMFVTGHGGRSRCSALMLRDQPGFRCTVLRMSPRPTVSSGVRE